MVSYKIGVHNRKEARIVDLDKITIIKSLDKLDELTSTFRSEEELKVYLFNQELISSPEINKNLSIMYKMNNKVKKLPIIYQDMKKYLDMIYLRAKLMSAANNIELLEKLARHYSIGSEKFNPQGVNVSDIRMYISDVRSNGGNLFYSRGLEVALNDMFQKAVLKAPDKKTGEVKENYRGLRDLAMFFYKYEKELEKKEAKQEEVQNAVEPEWQQMTMMELMNSQNNTTPVDVEEEPKKFELSSEGDPLFPPNSEEERDYQRYLEHLEKLADAEPIENHPHYGR